MNRGAVCKESSALERNLVQCWWCSKEGVKDYQYGLCYNCACNVTNKITPGGMNRQSEEYKDLWTKLKTLVTKRGAAPGDDLIKAFIKSEDKQTRVTDVDLTLKILKKGEQAGAAKPRRNSFYGSKQSFKKAPSGAQGSKLPPKPQIPEQKIRVKDKSYLSGVGLKAMARCQSQNRPHPIFEDYEENLASVSKVSYSQQIQNSALQPVQLNNQKPPSAQRRRSSVGPSGTTGPLQRPVIDYGKPQGNWDGTSKAGPDKNESKYS